MEEKVTEIQEPSMPEGATDSLKGQAPVSEGLPEQTAEPSAAEPSAGKPSPEEELQRVKLELADLKDKFLRQAADFQNFRKRALEERTGSVEIGRTRVAHPMVDVLDDLRRSVEESDALAESGRVEPGRPNSAEALRAGVRMVYEKFATELGKLGITPMEEVGKAFDENRHEAIMQQPSPQGVQPGTVIIEVAKGYMIGDKVLRHARVVVTT